MLACSVADVSRSDRGVHSEAARVIKAGRACVAGLPGQGGLRVRLSEDAPRSQDTLLFALDDWKNSRASSCLQSPVKEPVCVEGQRFQRRTSDISAISGSQALLQLLQQDVSHALSSGGKRHDAAALAADLVESGWKVNLMAERSLAARRLALNLPAMPFSPFILITGYMWGTVASETSSIRAVVEADFRSRFELSLQGGVSANFRAALEALPGVFVGSPDLLHETVVGMCCRMKQEFAAQSLALPPWRSEAALLSRWFPLDNRRSQQFEPGQQIGVQE